MTTSKTRKTPTPEATLQTQEEHFTFGVTIEQIDRFHTLLRTITAQSDMVAVCSGKPLDATSLSVLGESIFNAARAVRGIVDEIDAQRLHAGGGTDPTC
ncbi:hypothetical protein [Xanthomonas campestris]|uniref:hypothetical protein n=1 Tax=Xanthomonas campestris TaxID=339 RepID=UPI001CC150D6|nr:hypothetical protein [Xanthomonas campestris]MEB2233559.1 hypothetical protein [Xanthomonas campestris pv. campestris]MEA9732915.1 hypothetical protein [Xanthomonas campestris]UAU34719.1 hypothetical protein JH290_00285 [Xanthomonas campestris pv. incanae]WDJ85074.1 hypothetical protein JH279_21460 [Xanthomonas campestris pv. incanae]WDJ93934.1 hypothetical protein JH260_21335 [Xanthomonas campestris pv. incanae]